jgi:hypothetical protein
MVHDLVDGFPLLHIAAEGFGLATGGDNVCDRTIQPGRIPGETGYAGTTGSKGQSHGAPEALGSAGNKGGLPGKVDRKTRYQEFRHVRISIESSWLVKSGTRTADCKP